MPVAVLARGSSALCAAALAAMSGLFASTAAVAQGRAAGSTAARPQGLIAYVHVDGRNQFHIWTMRTDGSHAHQLTTGRRVLDQEPALSADGRHIAFLRIRGLCRARCPHEGIWVMGSGGQHLHKIAGGDYFWPSWSPNGRRIAVGQGDGNRSWIDIMRADGSHRHRIDIARVHQASYPTWSPDGRRLAFTGVGSDGQEDLYAGRVDGSAVTRLTHDRALQLYPSWSPTGRVIAYAQAVSQPGGGEPTSHVMVIRLGGARPHRVTPDAANFPHFDSTGRWLLYEDDTNPLRPRLRIVHPNGTDEQAISHSIAATEPTWSTST